MILIILFCLFFLILSLIRFDYALCVIVALLPSYLIRFSLFGLPLTLLEAMILIAFAVFFLKHWLPSYRKKASPRQAYPFAWEIIALIVLSFIAVITGGLTESGLGIWKAYFFEPILVYIMVINILQEKRKRTWLLWSLLISALTVSLPAIYQQLSGQFIFNPLWAAEATRRVVSWFGYPNAIGLYLAPLVLIFIGWYFSRPLTGKLTSALKKILIITTIAASLAAIYFARSEGALIGIAAGLFVFGIASGKRIRIITLLLALASVIGILSYTPAKELAISKLTLSDLSGEIRQRQWKETFLALTGPRIISGAGLANYQAAVAPFHQEGIFFNRDKIENFDSQLRASSTLREKYWQPVEIYLYPHNIFLNFWSEIGLLGALVFTWLLFRAIWIGWRLSRSYAKENRKERFLAIGLMTALITILVHGLVDVPYFKNDLSVAFFIILAIEGLMIIDMRRQKL